MVRKVKISGPGRMGSTSAIKKSLKSKASKTKQIQSENSLVVRFLDEPEDFWGYYQHWFTDGPKPCVEGDCDGCNDDNPEVRRKAFRYLANAYSVDEQKVVPLELPKSLVEQLVGYFEKKGTLLDRDYELSRTGTGMTDTKYMASPDSPTRMNLSRFKKLDLGKILASMVDDAEEEEDDEDEEPVSRVSSKRRRSVDADDIDNDDDDDEDENPWDDEEDEDEDDEEEEAPRKRVKVKTAKSAVKRTVRKTTR